MGESCVCVYVCLVLFFWWEEEEGVGNYYVFPFPFLLFFFIPSKSQLQKLYIFPAGLPPASYLPGLKGTVTACDPGV